jgi:glutamyl-tRNA reductase
MAAIVVKVLRDRGVSRVGIVNRSAERAAALAQRHGGEPHGLPAIRKALAGAELVVACTGAAGVVVHVEDVREAMAASPTVRRMFVLDLAVPRDVDPGVADLPGVSLADVDDLAGTLVRGAEVRASLRDGATIVGQEVARFATRRRAARLAPLIEALRARGDRIREAEVAAVMAKLDLTPQERAAIEAMSRAIVAKLLHEPIVRVKELSGSGGGSVPGPGPGPGDHHARALAELFGLEYRPGP